MYLETVILSSYEVMQDLLQRDEWSAKMNYPAFSDRSKGKELGRCNSYTKHIKIGTRGMKSGFGNLCRSCIRSKSQNLDGNEKILCEKPPRFWVRKTSVHAGSY